MSLDQGWVGQAQEEPERAPEPPHPKPHAGPVAVLQRTALVGATEDPAEAEADRVAALVVRTLAAPRPTPTAEPDRVQRSALSTLHPSPAAGQTPRIRRAAAVVGSAGGEVDADTDARIRAGAGGTPMDPGTRTSMEGAFGADFSSVRVHSGAESRELNERIQASAFTAGNHVWFRDGMPDTSTPGGQHLLAHELTHVVQQGSPGVRRRTTTIRRRGGKHDQVAPPLDLEGSKGRKTELEKQKLTLVQQIAAQEDKVAKSNLISKIGAKSKLNDLKKQLAKVQSEIDGLSGRIGTLQLEAEAKRQAAIDKATKDYATIATMRLGALSEYVAATANWHENSNVSATQRALVDEVLAFGSVPENQAPCAAFTVAAMEAAAPGNGGTMAALIERLTYYVAAAGDRRDPFPVSVQKLPAHAAKIGAALQQLLGGGFPTWVLAGAMKEGQLYQLINNGYIADVIAYFKFGANPPVFQAEGGADFESYLQMRLVDKVDPASFQGGPLSAYVRNFHRFEAPALKALAKNLANTAKQKPLTLILHSAIDHNGAFHRDPNMTQVIANKKNLTLMVEGGVNLADYQSQIGPLARSHGVNDKIDQVMFAGHGGSRIIELAGGVKENTVDVDKHGTIAQIDKPIDLNRDPDGARAFFDEILANMDKAVVDKLAPPGPDQQQNRRILFNACLTNSNEVRKSLSLGRDKAREEIREYIEGHASLATFMATYAKSKGADVTSLGANASITQVKLIDSTTGALDLYAPDDAKVTAPKLIYMEEGTEPHGVLLAALETWAYQPAEAKAAMQRRAAKHSTKWDEAVIEGAFELALLFDGKKNFTNVLQRLAHDAHVLSEMRLKDKCRVTALAKLYGYWKSDPKMHVALFDRLGGTTLFQERNFTALVLAQVDHVARNIVPAGGFMLSNILPKFDAKTARDFVDIKYLADSGKLATLMSFNATPGSITLATLGVLDPSKPDACVEHLRKLLEPGAPSVPKLAAVAPVPEVPEGVGPRAEIPEVPEVKGRAKVDEIPGKRDPSPEVPDLPALPKMPAVAGPGPKVKGKTPPAPKAPKRDGRPGREEAPEIAEVKPFFDAKHGLENVLAGRATEAAIAALVAS